MKVFGKIPITIHPFFWLVAALIGFVMSRSLLGAILFIPIILISVLVHEFGHALMAVVFKRKPKIELNAMGGLTSYEGKNLKYYQQFLIVLNGPLFGIGLFGLATLILWLGFFQGPVILNTLRIFQIINLFWSIINLIPVLPLDGGQLLRIAMEAFFGIKGLRLTFLIGFIISGSLALGSFAFRFYLLGALFFLFAFQSFDMFRRSKNISKSDRDENLTEELKKAQLLLEQGNKGEAEKLFEDLRNKTHEGLIFIQATHFLAFLAFEKKENKKAYEYLLSVKDKLSEEATCLLHNLAFEENNYELVKKLSANCYRLSPTKKNALINARTFAILGEAKLAGGWLKTAKQFGSLDMQKILMEKYFEKVKKQPNFKHFFEK